MLVLMDATDKIIRDADVERAAGPTCEKIDVEPPHLRSFANRDGRDKPGHDVEVSAQTKHSCEVVSPHRRHHRAAPKARVPVTSIHEPPFCPMNRDGRD